MGAADLVFGAGGGLGVSSRPMTLRTELAGSGAVAARGLKLDLKVHLASQSPRQFRENLLCRGVRRAELEEQLVRNGA